MNTKTLDEKLYDVAVLNDQIKNIKHQKQFATNTANEDGMIQITLQTNGERCKMLIPATLITDYLVSLETIKQEELDASMKLT